MHGLATRTVLVVEDEWLVRMELATAFEDEQCVVLESASAEDALTSLQARNEGGLPIDLLITDIRLSGTMTGWDLAIAARALDATLPVIYLSANPPAPAQEVVGSVFIDKPATMGQVMETARRLVG